MISTAVIDSAAVIDSKAVIETEAFIDSEAVIDPTAATVVLCSVSPGSTVLLLVSLLVSDTSSSGEDGATREPSVPGPRVGSEPSCEVVGDVSDPGKDGEDGEALEGAAGTDGRVSG